MLSVTDINNPQKHVSGFVTFNIFNKMFTIVNVFAFFNGLFGSFFSPKW